MTLMPKERRKQMIFDYLRGLKNPVTAEHVGEKFKITKRRADQLLVELAGDDLVVKTKGPKQHWKRTMVSCFAVKDKYRTYKKREPKVVRAWHDPFGLGVRA
jgi:hypothetical protein